MTSFQRLHRRRAVELPCELITRSCETPMVAWATDLSPTGVFVEHDVPLLPGDVLVVCLRPLVGWDGSELMVFAEVARWRFGRRRGEGGVRGVGLRFLDLTVAERQALERWLEPRLEAMPVWRMPPPSDATSLGLGRRAGLPTYLAAT